MVRKLGMFIVATLFAGSAFAELNIAIINVQRAIGDSAEAQTLLKKLETDLGPEQDALKSLGTEIQGLQEKLKKDSEVMSEAEQRKQQKVIEDKQMDYQFRVNKLQKTVQDRQQEILTQMAPKVDAVLKDLIAAQKYDLILQRQSALYVDNKLDITAKVTELLNEKK